MTHIEAFTRDVIERAQFSVEPMDLARSSAWAFRDGSIRHSSGRFFSVVGAAQESLGIEQPLIEQREVGTLGFLVDTVGRPRILVHAKVEPGNVGIAQLAPTCQATASNAAQVHGGAAPPYLDEFYSRRTLPSTSSLQSEQGTRFLEKHNRNVIVEARRPPLAGPDHTWLEVDELLELSRNDFLLNTDARSVLVSSDWRSLVQRQPFTRARDELSRELATSMQRDDATAPVRVRMTRARNSTMPARTVPLDALPGWRVTASGVEARDGASFDVRHISVVAANREVPRWDQPIIDSRSDGSVQLWCARRNGSLEFLFRAVHEIGLRSLIELSATNITAPGDESRDHLVPPPGSVVVASTRESDEGGRFFHDISRYELLDVGEVFEAPESFEWLSVGDIHRLLREGSWFTNEARSALSLLLDRL